MLILAVITVIVLLLNISMSHEFIHWLVPVGVRYQVSKSDIYYGISTDFP